MIKRSLITMLWLISGAYSSFCQHFSYEATLPQVPGTGFYKIGLEPDLMAHLKTDLSDLRIWDGKHFVPYIKLRAATRDSMFFQRFALVASYESDSTTTIIIDKGSNLGTDNLSLILGNTAVQRYCKISGSADSKSWHIIDDHIILQNGNNATQGRYVQSLYFPLCRDRYIKLLIDNAHTDPLNIIGAGMYQFEGKKSEFLYTKNPTLSIRQADSNDQRSYITVFQDDEYPIGRINIKIASKLYYERPAEVYSVDQQGQPSLIMDELQLSSSAPGEYDVPIVKTKQLLLIIRNGDNPPLEVTAVGLSHRKVILSAFLEQGRSYRLMAGNSKAIAPVYDLELFKDSIPENVPVLKYAAPVFVAQPKVSKPPPSRDWLWPVIISVILLLGFLSFRMVREIRMKG